VPIDPRRVQSVFLAAAERPTAAARAAYLDAACGDDAALRRRVEALLRAHDQPGSFLGEPATPLAADGLGGPGDGAESPGGRPGQPPPLPTVDEPVCERPGTVIGLYRLREQLGEGGMGLVFVAEQQQPVRRKVALKVIKPGMDTREVIARFEAERQALALMDHPNIARVLDAGATESGRPYFVMELVKGVPITQFCDDNRLTTRERLGLFVSVCQAVQHAHQKGIIHRDIKPANVLVTSHDGTPVVKVIDFGVAKAIGQQLTDKMVYTQLAQLVGTPLYMSPEQAGQSGLDIDTRSDIYSLGVLLYELLTGTTPFDKERLREAGYEEMRRIIREEDPPRPSTRISTLGQAATTVCARRQSDPRRLRQLFRGELDWVVMKCLEKDRTRRYETANGLAMDLHRYLADEPVLACPPSAGYKLRKFVRRHRTGVAVGVLVVFFLVLLVGGAGWVARDRAARHAVLEREVPLALADAETAYRHDRLAEARAALTRAEGLLAGGGGTETLAGRVRRWRADLAMVARLDEIRLEQAAVKDGHFDVAGADPAYRAAFGEYGLDVEALDPDEVAARIGDSAIRDRLVAALDGWVMARAAGGRSDTDRLLDVARRADRDRWRERLRETFVRRDGKSLDELARDPDVLGQPPATVLLLAAVLGQTLHTPQAVEVLQQAQHAHPGDFWINHMLAAYLLQVQPVQAGEAVAYSRAALALRPDSPGAHLNLANALQAQNHLAEAEAEYREAFRLQPDFVLAHNNLGHLLLRRGKLEDAEAEFRTALHLQPGYAYSHAGLISGLLKQGKADEAEAEYREDARLRPKDAGARAALGLFLLGRDKPAEAEAELREAVHLDPDQAAYHHALGTACARREQWDGAAGAYGRAVALGATDKSYWEYYALAALGAGDVGAYRRACSNLLQDYGRTDDPELANTVAWACVLSADSPADRQVCVRLAEKARASQPKRHAFLNTLGAALYRAGDYPAAARRLDEAMAAYGKGGYAGDWVFLALCHHRLGHAEEARGWLDKAVRWLDEVEQSQAGRNAPWPWQRRLELRLLCREAEALIRGETPDRSDKD
jgi:serine/threonine protein kinase/Tfp pilus assembly protein PilF